MNKGKQNIRKSHEIIMGSVVFIAAVGCNLTDIEKRGDFCPPFVSGTDARVPGQLEKIGDVCDLTSCKDAGLKKYLDTKKCPQQFPDCMHDGEHFYCAGKASCPDGQFLCEEDGGTFFCVDPLSQKTCGAVEGNCKDKSYGGYDCSLLGENGYCDVETKTCTCTDHTVLYNGKCISPKDPKTCGIKEGGKDKGQDCTLLGKEWECAESNEGWKCYCRSGLVQKDGKCLDQVEVRRCPEDTCALMNNGVWGCDNTDKSCGADCEDCTKYPNGYCYNGKCYIGECALGEYPHYSGSRIDVCVPVSMEKCGPHDMKMKDETTNCNALDKAHAKSVKCSIYGSCSMICDSNYYFDEKTSKCIEHSPVSCTPENMTTRCSNMPHATRMTCEDSHCVVARCEAGYHISADKYSCEANADNACALPDSSEIKNCAAATIDHASKVDCLEGECKVIACEAGYHISENRLECIANTAEACGGTGWFYSGSYRDHIKACTGVQSVCRNGACACPNEGDILKDDQYCVPKVCLGFPGVSKGSVRDGVCFAEACEASYELIDGVCVPTFATGCAGYIQPEGEHCSECKENCGISVCGNYYRYYKGACIDAGYCCGTRENDACINCLADGYKACNITLGKCVN